MHVPIITVIMLLSPCAQAFYIYSDVFTFSTCIPSYIDFLSRMITMRESYTNENKQTQIAASSKFK